MIEILEQKEKNVKFYYCHSTEWCISAERRRGTEKTATFSASAGHTCEEKQDIQICKIAPVHAQSCFSDTLQQVLLF